MSIKIHHGPPGSYKTSGAVMDDLIPAIKEGRVVVTNIRGFNEERARDVFPDAPASFEVISIDTKTAEGRKLMATWFHWVPLGAFLIFDEAQMIWPKSWRDTFLDTLKYPIKEGFDNHIDSAAADGRPAEFVEAFDMHRHYNWDLVLTTPDIRKIRDDIRGAGEFAYKHKNLALLGNLPFFKGRYSEGTHLIGDNGSNVSQFTTVLQRKITPDVWNLYDSTATGNFSDTKAGRSILRDPKIMALLACVVVGFAWGIPSFLASPLVNPEAAKSAGRPVGAQAPKVAAPTPASAAPDRVYHDVPDSQPRAIPAVSRVGPENDPLLAQPIQIAGYMQAGVKEIVYFSIGYTTSVSHFNSDQLRDMGYSVSIYGPCAVRVANLAYRSDKVVNCPAVVSDRKALGLTGAGFTPPPAERPQFRPAELPPVVEVKPSISLGQVIESIPRGVVANPVK